MNSLRIGISTQTPLLRFTGGPSGNGAKSLRRGILSTRLNLTDGYQLTPGGVCRMVLPSIRAWSASGWVREAHWFSLQPHGPRDLSIKDLPLTLHHLRLSASELAAYSRTKEKLWADIHGIPSPPFGVEDFRFYSRYNWFTSDSLLEQVPDLDLAYVHDFQLLQVGALLGLAAPTVFRWHVPLEPSRIPRYTRNFLVKLMEDFDSVIVSTRRDLEGLANVGFRGHVRQLYPHIDRREWPDVTEAQIRALEHEWGLGPEDPLILVVARMDPIKRQDVAIRALANLRRKHPRARLALVGNGSFSGSSSGGLGLSKPQKWARRLQRLVRQHRLKDRVIFAHWVPDSTMAAAYARAHVVLLPSDIEGFGITVLEAWRYGRPCVVSTGAGVSEVVQEGLTGYLFPAGRVGALSERIDRLLRDSERREEMSRACRATLRSFDAQKVSSREKEILEEAVARYGVK